MKARYMSSVVLFSAVAFLAACSSNDRKDRLEDAKAAQDEMKLKNKAIEEKLDAGVRGATEQTVHLSDI